MVPPVARARRSAARDTVGWVGACSVRTSCRCGRGCSGCAARLTTGRAAGASAVAPSETGVASGAAERATCGPVVAGVARSGAAGAARLTVGRLGVGASSPVGHSGAAAVSAAGRSSPAGAALRLRAGGPAVARPMLGGDTGAGVAPEGDGAAERLRVAPPGDAGVGAAERLSVARDGDGASLAVTSAERLSVALPVASGAGASLGTAPVADVISRSVASGAAAERLSVVRPAAGPGDAAWLDVGSVVPAGAAWLDVGSVVPA